MKLFAELFDALDRTASTSRKSEALELYFRATPPADAAWALYFLLGNRPKRAVKLSQLREWMAEFTGYPTWLVEECYEAVGDVAETLALLAPSNGAGTMLSLSRLVEERLLPMAESAAPRKLDVLRQTGSELGRSELFLWHKLTTGGFRVGVAKGLVVHALARVAGVEESVMATRLAGKLEPSGAAFERILSGESPAEALSRPYPFYLASPLEGSASALGDIHDWMVEWKWDGVRAQLLLRTDACLIWSRGEEVLSDSFPDILAVAGSLPKGLVLDGELLAWKNGHPLPVAALQQRLNRKQRGQDFIRETPVVFMAYDLLELEGRDIRSESLKTRRAALEAVIDAARVAWSRQGRSGEFLRQGDLFESAVVVPPPLFPLVLSPRIIADSWGEVVASRSRAREQGTEGLMLKRQISPYGVGRQRGDWWKWKLDPFTCDVVLVGAQAGHGRRASLYTDYTFAVWSNGALLPVARACAGLSEAEIEEVDAYVKKNTTGHFGPVRAVKPELVFELAFEGIAESTRHKSGIALRSPRIARWRRDKPAAEVDSLDALRMNMGSMKRFQVSQD